MVIFIQFINIFSKLIKNNIERNLEIKTILNDIEILNQHKKIADNQRNLYNFSKKNLSEDSLLIELDWKQKLLIGCLFFFRIGIFVF